MIIHHDRVEFIPEMQVCFNIWKISHCIVSTAKQKIMVVSINKKILDKIHFVINTLIFH